MATTDKKKVRVSAMNDAAKTSTHFAPAGRAKPEELDLLSAKVTHDPVVQNLLMAIDGFVVMLNPERQVLAANQKVMDVLGIKAEECLGHRPGELFGCVCAKEGPDGCGTSLHCRKCGAVLAILGSQKKAAPVEEECLLTRDKGGQVEAAEFRVRSTPVSVGGETLYAFVLQDISSSKRRQALERIFFHDLLNIVGGLTGYIELLETRESQSLHHLTPRLAKLVGRLSQEIQDHRVLLEAERGELTVSLAKVHAADIMNGLRAIFAEHEAAHDREFKTKPAPGNAWLKTDSTLLLRVMVNMVKNALEATPPGGKVLTWFEWEGETPLFVVHNEGEIPQDVALQIFKRSYTTKGEAGRGLGTYSMKLIGENYLKGKVSFTTSAAEGTFFYISLPKEG